jgi:membrane fusion protein, multidrug efflux system
MVAPGLDDAPAETIRHSFLKKRIRRRFTLSGAVRCSRVVVAASPLRASVSCTDRYFGRTDLVCTTRACACKKSFWGPIAFMTRWFKSVAALWLRVPNRWQPLLLCVLLVACNRPEGTATGGQAAAQSAPPPPLMVSVQAMRPQRVPIVLEAVGQTEGSKAVEVRARVGGILERQLYREGEAVKAGASLFQIDRAPYEIALEQARAALAQDQAHIEQTRRDVDRLKPLAQDRAVSLKEYDDALSSAQLARASLQQSQARVHEAELNLSYTSVNAPVAGTSGRAEHSVGSLITIDVNGSLLTTINQLDPMWVRFSFAQTDLAKLPTGRIERSAGADVSLVLPDGKVYPAKGRLNFAATQIDPRLGTQQMRAAFDNPNQDLVPGQFVRVRVAAGERDNVYLVPQSAVIQTEKSYLVFVVEDGKAVSRPVQTGEWYGSNWAILSGLKTGDKVIVDNLVKVRPGAPVTAQAAAPANAAAAGTTPAPAPANAAGSTPASNAPASSTASQGASASSPQGAGSTTSNQGSGTAAPK